MIQDPLTIAALVAGVTALAFWLDRRSRTFSKVGASLLVILFGAVLSNTGFVPHDSPVYRGIEGPVTSLAIIYLLLGVALADLKEAGPRMLVLFLVASVGTALGALAGAALFADALGPVTWKLAGAFTGTYTGGSLNFAAVGRGLGLPPSTFAAASAADNVTTAIWTGITLTAPLWLLRKSASGATAANPGITASAVSVASDEARQPEAHPFWGRTPISLFDLVLLAAIGMAVLIAAHLLEQRIGRFPEILWLTTIALLLAQVPAVRAIGGAQQLGYLGLHLFLAVIGIRSLVAAMIQVGPAVFLYTLVVVGVHGIFLFLLGRALRGPVPMLAVVSQAAVGGPSTAMAVAIARGYKELALPAVAVGVLGYALGNYAGFAIAYLVRGILGG
ncbi:MAG: DUF819 family protein [Gemmatimonadota bacterium]|nr:MAG: DUF819 family protein [Gemmatimonadota bacterium]